MNSEDARVFQNAIHALQNNITNVAEQVEAIGQAMKTYTADQTRKMILMDRRVAELETRNNHDPQSGSDWPLKDRNDPDLDLS